MSHNNVLSHLGTKYLLPINTERRKHEVTSLVIIFEVHELIIRTVLKEYEEVIVPPARAVPPRETEHLITVSELDDLCGGSFPVNPINYQ